MNNPLMEWWRLFYTWIVVMLAVMSYAVFLLVAWLVVWLPYAAVKWVAKRVIGWITKRD